MAECIILSGDNQPDIIGLYSFFDSACFDYNLSCNSHIYIIICPLHFVRRNTCNRVTYISGVYVEYKESIYEIHRRHLNQHSDNVCKKLVNPLLNFVSRVIYDSIRLKCQGQVNIQDKWNRQLLNRNNY